MSDQYDHLRPDGTRRHAKLGRHSLALPLFDHAEASAETKASACVAAKKSSRGREALLLNWLRSRGFHGATAWESHEALQWPYSSFQSLFQKLCEAGLVRRNGLKRPTKAGCMAAVYVGAEVPQHE